MPNIDDLSIGIKSNVVSATNSIDKLISRLGVLSASLGQVNTSGFQQMARGISQIEIATKSISADSANKLATLSLAIRKFGSSTANAATSNIPQLSNSIKNLANTINSIGSLNFNADGLSNFASTINKLGGTKVSDAIINIPILSATLKRLASSIADLGEVSNVASVENLSILANSLSKLGGKASTNAITNIPQLTTSLMQMMNTLSRAPQVSRNTIDLTNALANLASQGSRTGSASRSLQNSLNGYSSSAKRAASSSKGLASAIGKLYAKYWLLFRAFGKLGKGITLASDLTEVQNVVDVTFGKYKNLIEEFSKTSIQDYGMSELTAKQMAGRFQAMGTAVGFSQEKMADMSVTLTALAADMASFYNVEQKDVAESLESVFTGTTKPLRQYGIDLTEATLSEWLMSQGIDANIKSMTQAEKVLLRYNYVLEHTQNAQGDFARTQDSFANQIRILKQQFEALGAVIGQNFIYALKPMVQGLNVVMGQLIQFAKVVSESLGTIFGWKYEETTGGIANDLELGSEFADDLSTGLDDAADSAKKLKNQLQGFDELNVLSTQIDTAGNNKNNIGNYEIPSISGGQWVKLEDEEKFFSSELDTLNKLGDYIGKKLTNQLKSIKWNDVYSGAKGFGTGLASFLNGLISPDLFNATGKTIAGSLNTAIYTALSFGQTFDFDNFGDSIADGINGFFEEFDFKALAQTLNTWAKGLRKTFARAINGIKFEDVVYGALDFLNELELDTVVTLAAISFLMKGGLKKIASNSLKALIGRNLTAPELAIIATVGLLSFKLGQQLSKNKVISDLTDKLVEWLYDGGDSINITKLVTVSLAALTISIGVAKVSSSIISGITTAITTASATVSTNAGIKTAMSGLASKIFLGFTAALTTAFAGFQLGNWLYENNIFGIGDAGDKIAKVLVDDLGLFVGTGKGEELAQEFRDKVEAKGIFGKVYGAVDTSNKNIANSFKKLGENTARNILVAQGALKALGIDSSSTSKIVTKDVKAMWKSGDYLTALSTLTKNATSEIKSNAKSNFDSFKKNAINSFKSFSDSAKTETNNAKKNLSAGLTGLNAVISKQSFKKQGSNLISTLTKGISEEWNNKKIGVNAIVNNLLSYTTKNSLGGNTTWKTAGENLVDGLKSGINIKWGTGTTDKKTLMGSVTDLASNLTNSLKKAFGIHSPSREWASVGRYLTQGLEIGTLSEEGHLNKSVIAMGTRLTDNFSSSLTLATPSSLSSNYDFGITSTMAHTYSADSSMSNNIAEGISKGMYSVQAEQNALLREQNELLYQILQKDTISADDVYNVVVSKNRDAVNRSGYSPLIV